MTNGGAGLIECDNTYVIIFVSVSVAVLGAYRTILRNIRISDIFKVPDI